MMDTSRCAGEITGACGNGQLQPDLGEQCDGANLNGLTCTDLGFGGGELSCSSICRIDYSRCAGISTSDTDGDGVPDAVDNCPDQQNPAQADSDYDGIGNTCDSTDDRWGTSDPDGDLIPSASDNCPYTANPDQEDINSDGVGDICQYTDVAAGSFATCAVTMDEGRVVCWGMGMSESSSSSATPVPIMNSSGQPVKNVKRLVAGGGFMCALTGYGTVYCWGDNSTGQMGNGLTGPGTTIADVVRSPEGPGPLSGVASLSAGQSHACALLSDRHVVCWGSNSHGQLGNPQIPVSGENNYSSIPVYVVDGSGQPLRSMTMVSAGSDHSCAVSSQIATGEVDGVWCWGSNAMGQCGLPWEVSEQPDATTMLVSAVQLPEITGFFLQ